MSASLTILSLAALAAASLALSQAGAAPAAPSGADAPAPAPARKSKLFLWEKLVYLLTWIALLGMAATGVGAIITGGFGSLHGWLLWMHFAVAPAFIIGLTLMVLTWADRHRLGGRTPAELAGRCRSFTTAGRILFWAVAVLGFAAIAAIMLSMLQLFTSEFQWTLYMIHRVCALVLVVVMLMHLLTIFRAEKCSNP